MRIRKNNKGFTIIELLGVMGIMSAMIYMASNFTTGVYRDVKFNDYANKIEYFAKYAKIQAIKKSSYVGLCIQDRVLTLRDMGASPSINTTIQRMAPCDISITGSNSKNLIKQLDLSNEKYVLISSKTPVSTTITDVNTHFSNNFVYDARGLAVKPSNSNAQYLNSICLSNGGKYIEYKVNLVSVMKSSGVSTCP